jgi:tellurite methyltransferase
LSNSIKDKWEKRYQSSVTDTEDKYPSAVEVLRNNQHLLPESGSALDLACGLGANAICLAEHGLTTSAWDISASALEQLTNYSKKYNLHIITKERDVTPHPPVVNSFDVIVISRFLDRNLIPHIKNAIKPKGLIFYQTFTKEKVNQSGPSNPDFLLDKNELLNCFHDWQILFYREEGITGNIKLGFRNQAMLVAEKP